MTRYIANPEEHHQKRTHAEEYDMFVKKYALEWRGEKPLKWFQLSLDS